MEAAWTTTLTLIVILLLIWAWKILNWLWFNPKRLEKLLREQGFQGNPYKLLVGDSKEFLKMRKEALSKPMDLSDDIVPRVSSYINHSVKSHGMFVIYDSILFCNFHLFTFFKYFSILIIRAHAPLFFFNVLHIVTVFYGPLYTVLCFFGLCYNIVEELHMVCSLVHFIEVTPLNFVRDLKIY